MATDTADLTPDKVGGVAGRSRRPRTVPAGEAGEQTGGVGFVGKRYVGMFHDARCASSLSQHPEWPPLLAKLQAALARYPEAAAAVAEALEDE